jgi:hypothetical protein
VALQLGQVLDVPRWSTLPNYIYQDECSD